MVFWLLFFDVIDGCTGHFIVRTCFMVLLFFVSLSLFSRAMLSVFFFAGSRESVMALLSLSMLMSAFMLL